MEVLGDYRDSAGERMIMDALVVMSCDYVDGDAGDEGGMMMGESNRGSDIDFHLAGVKKNHENFGNVQCFYLYVNKGIDIKC